MLRKILIVFGFFLFFSCSIENAVYKYAGRVLTSTGDSSVLMGEEDPALIGESFPILLKLYELLLDKDPANADLAVTTGSMFVMYANAFVQGPADTLPDDQYKLRASERLRAKKFYLRGRSYILAGLDVRHPGFIEKLSSADYGDAFMKTGPHDSAGLYWGAAAWLAAASIDLLDLELTFSIPQAVAMLTQAFFIDETYGAGSLHELFFTIYLSVPVEMLFRSEEGEDTGSSLAAKLDEYYSARGIRTADEKIDYHYNRALELAEGKKLSPYLAYATGVYLKNEDRENFTSAIDHILAFDLESAPENRLLNILTMQKAVYYQGILDDLFW